MVIGQLVAAAGCLGTAFGGSLVSIMAFRFLGGVGSALGAAGAQTYLYDVTEKKHLQPIRGVVIGCQGGLIAASYVIGPTVGGFLTQLYGPSAAYCVVTSVLVAVAGACAVLPETRMVVPLSTTCKNSPLASALSALHEAMSSWRSLLKEPNQQGLCIANMALFLNYAAGVAVLPLQAFREFGASPGDIGALYGIGSMIGIVLAPAAGWLSDRFGRVPLVLPSTMICGMACLGMGFSGDWLTFVAAYIGWNIGQAILSPLLLTYAADIAPRSLAGAAMSLSRQSQDLVFFIGPVALGCIYDLSPGPAAMAVTAGVSLISGICCHVRAKDVCKR
jgi:MFS family permease